MVRWLWSQFLESNSTGWLHFLCFGTFVDVCLALEDDYMCRNYIDDCLEYVIKPSSLTLLVMPDGSARLISRDPAARQLVSSGG